VLRPNTHMLLDGEWRFALDNEDRGLSEGWYLGHQYNDTANWPGSIEDHMAMQNTKPRTPGAIRVIAWYEREFPLPECTNGNGAPHTMIQLTFGACGYETRVWLNGFR
jgi:beta-galactosidase/beta-glucuronidase